jgi:predicted amidophosphoribosyltransferase
MDKAKKLDARCGFCEESLAMNEGEMCPRCVERFAAHVRSWKSRRFFDGVQSDFLIGGALVFVIGIASYFWGYFQ